MNAMRVHLRPPVNISMGAMRMFKLKITAAHEHKKRTYGPHNPVKSGYPEDGSCSYCGNNKWTIYAGVPKCAICKQLDP